MTTWEGPYRAKGGQRGSQKIKNAGKMTCQKSMLNFDAEKIEKGDKCRAPGPGLAVLGGSLLLRLVPYPLIMYQHIYILK